MFISLSPSRRCSDTRWGEGLTFEDIATEVRENVDETSVVEDCENFEIERDLVVLDINVAEVDVNATLFGVECTGFDRAYPELLTAQQLILASSGAAVNTEFIQCISNIFLNVNRRLSFWHNINSPAYIKIN